MSTIASILTAHREYINSKPKNKWDIAFPFLAWIVRELITKPLYGKIPGLMRFLPWAILIISYGKGGISPKNISLLPTPYLTAFLLYHLFIQLWTSTLSFEIVSETQGFSRLRTLSSYALAWLMTLFISGLAFTALVLIQLQDLLGKQ
jgi:hypothetical protein